MGRVSRSYSNVCLDTSTSASEHLCCSVYGTEREKKRPKDSRQTFRPAQRDEAQCVLSETMQLKPSSRGNYCKDALCIFLGLTDCTFIEDRRMRLRLAFRDNSPICPIFLLIKWTFCIKLFCSYFWLRLFKYIACLCIGGRRAPWNLPIFLPSTLERRYS